MGTVCSLRSNTSIVHPSLKTSRNSEYSFRENFIGSPFKQIKSLPVSYKKGDLIGEGSCGKVYRCLNLSSGDLLAVKTLKLSNEDRRLKLEINRLKQEIKILKGLSHENIVKYYGLEVKEVEQEVDILLEYIPGGSLKDVLHQYGKFNEKLVAIYIYQILNALIYLHSLGIIHRDIKGANILIDIDGTIKLTDFSISRKDIDGLLSRSLKGTPNWMAPEIAMRTGHGPKADIWSLGCVIIEMMTGLPPFFKHNQTLEEIIGIIASGRIPEYPNKLSKDGREFLDCCLQKNQDKRLRADELIDMPFITLNCKDYKNFSLKNIEINRREVQKAVSMSNIPSRKKLSELKKLESQHDVAIFDTVKYNSNSKKNNEQIIKTVLSQKMREDREEEIKEIKLFNEQKKKQWENALTGKF